MVKSPEKKNLIQSIWPGINVNMYSECDSNVKLDFFRFRTKIAIPVHKLSVNYDNGIN